MSEKITHHPSDETLAAHAAGTLDRARGLVVAMHVGRCQSCGRQVGLFEAVGGALLDSAPAASLRPDALETALGRLETRRRTNWGQTRTRLPAMYLGLGVGSGRACTAARSR